MQGSRETFLVADVGGTKSVFALVQHLEDITRLEQVQSFASKDFDRFDDVLAGYLSSCGILPSVAVLAVAGPIFNDQASITNLPWHLDGRKLESEFGFTAVQLINDLESMAWSIPNLAPEDVMVLQTGCREPGAPMALIAPGTGLGEAFLTLCGSSYGAHATEGGHADFARRDATQERLLAHLRTEFEHVSVERVCSGAGLADIYRFLDHELRPRWCKHNWIQPAISLQS